MKTVKITFTTIAEIEVDEESCDIKDAVQDVEDTVRVALNKPVSLGAAAVELGAIVRSVEREYEVQDWRLNQHRPMEFRIADTFTNSLTQLTSQEQKATKTTAFDLQLNPVSSDFRFSVSPNS